MSQALIGKVAIITGASSGIGAATARELARRGARVALAARRTRELEAEARAIREAGGSALPVPTDVTDEVQVTRLVECTREAFGPIDLLVNNAGANWLKPLTETSTTEMIRLLQVNLLGTMLLTHMVLPEMRQRQQGTIICVGSVASHIAIEPLYSATKFGVRGFSLALRRQLAGSGISVSLVTPGNIRTRMTSGLDERMPGPEVVARTIAGLAVKPSREVIVPFKYHAVVWLDRLLPGIADLAFSVRNRSHAAQDSLNDNLPAYARNTRTNDQRSAISQAE
jgi:short-subunit dehydrogenase